MARDYKLIERLPRGEIVFDEGKYTYVPNDFTPYKYPEAKNLRLLKKKIARFL